MSVTVKGELFVCLLEWWDEPISSGSGLLLQMAHVGAWFHADLYWFSLMGEGSELFGTKSLASNSQVQYNMIGTSSLPSCLVSFV